MTKHDAMKAYFEPKVIELVGDLYLEAINFAQVFMDWIELQDKNGNYPNFPDNCQIKKMECLQNMPNLAGINAEAGLARYMIQCRLIYFEREV